MSRFVEQAAIALGGAESQIQRLIHVATQERQYTSLSNLARVADKLREILADLKDSEGNPESGSAGICAVAELAAKDRVERRKRETSQIPQTEGPVERLVGNDYPRFLRDGDSIVKVGTSRTGGTTYEHRAPKAVLDLIVKRALVLASEKRRTFSAEALSDLRQHGQNREVPNYQLYLCLGWLKGSGLIKQHGRRGYSLSKAESFVSDVEKCWHALRE